MPNQKIANLSVEYKNVDGWHVFSSDELPGLYVASQDAETAYNDVAVAIEKLIELNIGVSCKAIALQPVSDFLRSYEDDHQAVEMSDIPPALYSRSYAVSCG